MRNIYLTPTTESIQFTEQTNLLALSEQLPDGFQGGLNPTEPGEEYEEITTRQYSGGWDEED